MVTRVYRWLLRLCPAPFRAEYGLAMEETFAARLDDARSVPARMRLLFRESWSVLLLAWTERRRRADDGAHRVPGGTGAGGMEQALRELHHAMRRLARSPGFTMAAAGTLALAIGVNAAIFTVVYRVVLNPLPYPDSHELVALDHGAPGMNMPAGLGMTSGLYFEYRERARTLEEVALYWLNDLTLTGVDEPDRIRVAYATPSLAPVLGVSPLIGRWFTESEGEPGNVPAVVLAHSFWRERFDGDAAVLGRSIVLSGVSYTVVGVMPAGFTFPDKDVRLWRTAVIDRAEARAGGFNYQGVARLEADVPLDRARGELNTFIADLANTYPNDPYASSIVEEARLTSTLLTLKSRLVGDIAESLWILLAAVGLVLLVACANVANLFLVRSESRQREIAVRHALGAGRGGIRRFFLSESLLLASIGAALGVVIAYAGVRLLVIYGPATMPRIEEVRLDYVVIAFSMALGVLSALLFGSFPMLRQAKLSPALHETGRGNTASRARHRSRHLLMGAQIALACVLVIGAGLMVRSFQALRAIDPNFDAESALTFRIGLPGVEYGTREAAILAHGNIIEALAAVPGVRAVSATTCMPLDERGFCHGDPLLVEGRPSEPGVIPPVVAYRAVAGEWFATIGTPIVRGRSIERADIQRNDAIAVVNERLAELYFPGEDAIGRRVSIPFPDQDPFWFTIVGVARNTPTFSLADADPAPKMYVAWQSRAGVGPGMSTMTYVVRAAASPLELIPAVRAAVARVDANLPLAQMQTLDDVLNHASAETAFTMALIVLAATVALVLGIIGIYGVVSYVVSQRAGEIGVRLALGAEPGRVRGMILRQGGLVTVLGLAAGLMTAIVASRSIGAILYDVSPTDPLIYAIAALGLLAVALLACWIPARRAARLSPIEALRPE